MLPNVTFGGFFWETDILRKSFGGDDLRKSETSPGRLGCNMPVERLRGAPLGRSAGGSPGAGRSLGIAARSPADRATSTRPGGRAGACRGHVRPLRSIGAPFPNGEDRDGQT